MEITTARLRMEPYTLADIDCLHRLWTDAEVRRYLWDNQVISREQAAEAVQGSVESWRTRGFGQWTLCRAAGAEPIGFAGLFELEEGPGVELVYGLAPSAWHQGYATEAAQAAVKFAWEQTAITRIWARTDRPNADSVGVLRRIGMREVTRPDDAYLTFAIDRNP